LRIIATPQASYEIQDTPEMIQQHYGRFQPQDGAALAARAAKFSGHSLRAGLASSADVDER
jgi:hypothetical protein